VSQQSTIEILSTTMPFAIGHGPKLVAAHRTLPGKPEGVERSLLLCRTLVQQRVYPHGARRPTFCLTAMRRIAISSRSSESITSRSRTGGA
jgi:hypothetical protein